MLWPPIALQLRHRSIRDLPPPAPSPPTRRELARHRRPGARRRRAGVIYGFRISVLFGLTLTARRFRHRRRRRRRPGLLRRLGRPGLPALHRDLVRPADALHADHPGQHRRAELLVAAGVMLLFTWMAWSAWCAPSSCARATSTTSAPPARWASATLTIMCRHILPNAMVATLTFLPFILNGVDHHADRRSTSSASACRPARRRSASCSPRARTTCRRPGSAITGFVVLAVMLSLLIFIGEAVRDAFDPRKTFA